MSEYGIVVFLTIIAAIISLITGMIAGVTFSGIIIRLIISSVVFALLGFGITLIMKKFLPEFFEDNDDDIQEDNNEPQMKSGENINVVLPDENPHVELNKEVDTTINELKDEVVAENLSGTENLEEEGLLNSDFVEEVSELGDETSEDNEVSKEIDTSEDNSEPDVEKTDDASTGALPNLDSFSDSFSETIKTSSVNEEIKNMDSSKIDTKLEILGLEKDTGVIAKAVQTFLKKDQEGN